MIDKANKINKVFITVRMQKNTKASFGPLWYQHS